MSGTPSASRSPRGARALPKRSDVEIEKGRPPDALNSCASATYVLGVAVGRTRDGSGDGGNVGGAVSILGVDGAGDGTTSGSNDGGTEGSGLGCRLTVGGCVVGLGDGRCVGEIDGCFDTDGCRVGLLVGLVVGKPAIRIM